MKNNYDPYPHNNERIGTLQYEDYMDYEYQFYNDKKFHEERLVRGAKLIKAAKVKSILLGTLTGVCTTGAVVVGMGILNAKSISNLFINFSALIFLAEASIIIVKEEILPNIRFIKNAKKDMKVSETMIKSLSKTRK